MRVQKKFIILSCFFLAVVIILIGVHQARKNSLSNNDNLQKTENITSEVTTQSPQSPQITQSAQSTKSPSYTNGKDEETDKSLEELVKEYGDLKLTDIHNHDASNSQYLRMMDTWEKDAVSRIVLFGDISEPSAIQTDAIGFKAFEEHPEFFIPFFAGFDLHDEKCLDVVKKNLEEGYFGVGEIAAASSFSPMVAHLKWKGLNPMDGYLPQIYEICAQYKVPILLHIDPPSGEPIVKLEEALDAYPDTIFIFGHINAYNSPENIKQLMEKHENLYADFMAGFTYFNKDSAYKLEDFIPVIKQFPDRFFLSTDSGYGLPSENAAIEAMYQLIDKLKDPSLAQKLSYENFNTIIQAEPATKTQIEAIKKLKKEEYGDTDFSKLTKLEAGKILYNEKEDE